MVPYVGVARQVDDQQLDQTIEVILVDRECPVHIGLAQCELGIDQEFAWQGVRVKTHGGGGCRPVTVLY